MGQSTVLTWSRAWKDRNFRIKAIAGFTLVLLVLAFFPFFFQAIERRSGQLIPDWVLAQLHARDLSVPIFLLIWASALLTLIRAVRSPSLFLQFTWSYFFLCLTRIITISLIPLDPPIQLIPLADPISNQFYGPVFVTRDLFFSGHTATLFLMMLCLEKGIDKIFVGIATIAVAGMLLIQHVHYTIDILAAPVLTWPIYELTKRITRIPSQKASPS